MNLDLTSFMQSLESWLWGWPLIIFFFMVSLLFTFSLRFAQFRYFITAWRYVFNPPKGGTMTEQYITPLQAFLNTLNASVGNGSVAGMATALAGGGPGAAFWVFVLGFLYMIIRYAEVYVSAAYTEVGPTGATRGGPMVYLKKVPGGNYLSYLYAFFCLGLALIAGAGMQCNSIKLGVERLAGVPVFATAGALFALMLYIMFGGAKRIIRFSERIAPIKVGLFFGTTLFALLYHYKSLIPALKTIISYALTPQAAATGALVFSMQQAIRYAMSRSINSTESGLGTAGIFFGATRSKEPVEDGIMSMVTSFVSSHLVAFVLMLLIVASGAWTSGLVSTQLTMAAYETAFGTIGRIIVAFLTITFGLGVLVAYAYIGRECWLYLTRGRFDRFYTILYPVMSLLGTLGQVDLIWNAVGVVNAGLVMVNLFGLLYLLPRIKAGLENWERAKSRPTSKKAA